VLYLLTAIGLTPVGSSTVHIYTQTIHRTTQLTTLVISISGIRTQIGQTNWKKCEPCPRVIPWHLSYNWGKSTENPLSNFLTLRRRSVSNYWTLGCWAVVLFTRPPQTWNVDGIILAEENQRTLLNICSSVISSIQIRQTLACSQAMP
jgi:hypothetical protein